MPNKYLEFRDNNISYLLIKICESELKLVILTLNFLLFITLISILYHEVYADSPSIFREIIYDRQNDFVSDEFFTNESKDSSPLPLIDIDIITYSSDGNRLNVTLFWDKNDLIHLRNQMLSGYIIKVFLNSGLINDQNSGFDYSYTFSITKSDQQSTNGSSVFTSLNRYFLSNGFTGFTSEEDELISDTTSSRGPKYTHVSTTPLTTEEISINRQSITLNIELSRIGLPNQYSFLVKTISFSDKLGVTEDYSSEIQVPAPDILIEKNKIDIELGTTKLNYLSINETHNYNVNTSISSSKLSDDVNVILPSEKNTVILGGLGNIPITVNTKNDQEHRNYIIPLTINYSLLDGTPLRDKFFVSSSSSISNPYKYSKTFYLNANTIPEKTVSLINFNDIPQEYIAIFVGAIFTFFIPSAARLVNMIRQNHNSSNHLKSINTIINNKKNLPTEFNLTKEKIMDDYIRGKINNEQYQTLNKKLSEYTNQFDKDYDDIY